LLDKEHVQRVLWLRDIYLYQCMVYISQYLPKLVENMNVPRIWHLDSINKFEGEVLLGKGKMRIVKGNYYMLT
jgi:hypothetical protein